MATAQKKHSRSTLTPTKRRKEKEELMLDELENIFLKHGFRKITVEHLASELRCSKRSLYELASNKEELFLRVFDRYLSRLRTEGDQNAKGVAPTDAFVGYLQPAINASRKLSESLINDMMAFEPAKDLWEKHRNTRMDGLKKLIDHCVDQGIFRRTHSLLVAEVFAASLQRICNPTFLSHAKLNYPDAVSELYQLLLNGLLHSNPEEESETLQQVTIQLQAKGTHGRKELLRELKMITEQLNTTEPPNQTNERVCNVSIEATELKQKAPRSKMKKAPKTTNRNPAS